MIGECWPIHLEVLIKYGVTRDKVLEIDAILSDGSKF
jgi:hypothetical protein